MIIRPAGRHEAGAISALALRSKAHWGYDEAFLSACTAELTLTPDDVVAQRVAVGAVGDRMVGFYTLAGAAPCIELSYLFVEPDRIGHGHGRDLWEHTCRAARSIGAEDLRIEADPFAEPFYRAMGAERTGAIPSASIPGRLLPVLAYRL